MVRYEMHREVLAETPSWQRPSPNARRTPARRSWFGKFLYIYFGI